MDGSEKNFFVHFFFDFSKTIFKKTKKNNIKKKNNVTFLLKKYYKRRYIFNFLSKYDNFGCFSKKTISLFYLSYCIVVKIVKKEMMKMFLHTPNVLKTTMKICLGILTILVLMRDLINNLFLFSFSIFINSVKIIIKVLSN